MPSRWTFKHRIVRQFVNFYMNKHGGVFIDPFSGVYSPAHIKNDIDDEKTADYHLHAGEFIEQLEYPFNGCIFDPPYSPNQVKECYKSILKKGLTKDLQSWRYLKRKIIDKASRPFMAISCGWNSNGFGKTYGFNMVHLLVIAHGREHNDTLITVEILK